MERLKAFVIDCCQYDGTTVVFAETGRDASLKFRTAVSGVDEQPVAYPCRVWRKPALDCEVGRFFPPHSVDLHGTECQGCGDWVMPDCMLHWADEMAFPDLAFAQMPVMAAGGNQCCSDACARVVNSEMRCIRKAFLMVDGLCASLMSFPVQHWQPLFTGNPNSWTIQLDAFCELEKCDRGWRCLHVAIPYLMHMREHDAGSSSSPDFAIIYFQNHAQIVPDAFNLGDDVRIGLLGGNRRHTKVIAINGKFFDDWVDLMKMHKCPLPSRWSYDGGWHDLSGAEV